MPEKLPSLLGWTPKFYQGGAIALHLPFLYDAVALTRPATVVTLGFGEGEAHFTFCQAVQEVGLGARCVAVRRDDGAEAEDVAWSEGNSEAQRLYPSVSELRSVTPLELAATFADGSVDLLLLDDCDSGAELHRDLESWSSKLAPGALILFHGTQLERSDSPRAAWEEWTGNRATAELPDGIGLGIARHGGAATELWPELFGPGDDAAEILELYRLAHRRMEAEVRAERGDRSSAALQVQKAWISSLMGIGMEAQRVIDHQVNTIRRLEYEAQQKAVAVSEAEKQVAESERKFQALHRDRAKAQLIMDAQVEQLQKWVATTETLRAERDKLKAQVKSQKQILNAAKGACRKGGKCFREVLAQGPKTRRPVKERLLREFDRWPKKLSRLWAAPPPAPAQQEKATTHKPVEDRYTTWINEHEPDAAALEEQRRTSASWERAPKISLLMPVLDPPANFLEEMLASVAAQTYDGWELCLIDAGSKKPETNEILDRWAARDQRLRLQRLPANLGIAENTNRAFHLATGDFIICVDHDDLLPPFAMYQMAAAIRANPDAAIFYSDEDRLSTVGTRHSPFFKPEWSPALLSSSMYLGHLTAYRRELVEELGGWRKEYDLSQDYDFALRATDQPRVIVHVPHVLYHWREHPASGSAGGKPDARKTNLAALADAMRRRNLPAEIIEYPAANRARLQLVRKPRVSVIIPTDSPDRARRCVEQLTATTLYPDYELLIVTNSTLAEVLRVATPPGAPVRAIPYDKPFNFSDKCNVGAEAATGERLIFYNDDVETEQREWIQNLIEPLENPEVGAVSPKLLYTTGRIQHAGLVTGVRGLVGTAFHQQPEESSIHFNLAQSLREVSALSGACLAMRRDDFFRCGGWDAVNTPIAASDFDLCFKLREAGLRCVYTPFATLRHTGHESIGSETPKADEPAPPRDKSSVYLLRRWGGYTAHDPYFTDNMRDWLYADSPTPIRMSGSNNAAVESSAGDLLLVSHDLTFSGAPMMLLHASLEFQRAGFFVTVMSPEDGPLRQRFEAAGMPVIIDPLVKNGHESFAALASGFDCVVANTIFSAPIVHLAFTAGVPVVWWLHETMVGEHYLREDPRLRSALPLADAVVAPSERAAMVYRPFRDRPVLCLRNAVPDVGRKRQTATQDTERRLEFLLLGTIEPRKGQDVFLKAIALLPPELQAGVQFTLIGRVNDPEFSAKLGELAKGLKNLTISGGVTVAEAHARIQQADVLVCASRDEAMPTVTMLEAMSMSKAILTSSVGGADEFLVDHENALLVRPEAAEALAGAMKEIIENPARARKLGEQARATYEERFTIERLGAEFCDLLKKVIPAPRVPTATKF